MSQAALQALVDQFGTDVIAHGSSYGDEWAYVQPARLVEAMTWLRDHPRHPFNMLIDVTAVDYLDYEADRPVQERFEVVYHLRSVAAKSRLRIKVALDEDDPELETVDGVWPAANWFEREIWDLYGVRFRGHPDLRRILLYEEFEGHPLRKDYPKERAQPLVGPEYTPTRPFLTERDLIHGPPVAVGSPQPADGSRSGPVGRFPSPANQEDRAMIGQVDGSDEPEADEAGDNASR